MTLGSEYEWLEAGGQGFVYCKHNPLLATLLPCILVSSLLLLLLVK